MRTLVTGAKLLVRLIGLVQLGLGILFWTNNARNLTGLHMLLGSLLVLLLWVQALLAARARAQPGWIALVAVWGVVVLALGMTQTQLLPGALHWIIQVLHLVVGMAALGFTESLAARTTAALDQALQPGALPSAPREPAS